MLSDAATFGYGSLGAVTALLIVQVLPWAIALSRGGQPHITAWRVFGAFLILVVFVVGGGVAAMVVSDDSTEAKQAIAYGLGWQGLLGGFIQGTVGPSR